MLGKFAVVAVLVVLALADPPQITICSAPNAELQNLKVTFTPNNIIPGQNLTVQVSGDLTKTVTDATMTTSVTFMGIPVFKKTFDICQEVPAACPMPSGPFSYKIDHQIPNVPIHGKVVADATIMDTVTNVQVVCVDATMTI